MGSVESVELVETIVSVIESDVPVIELNGSVIELNGSVIESIESVIERTGLSNSFKTFNSPVPMKPFKLLGSRE